MVLCMVFYMNCNISGPLVILSPVFSCFLVMLNMLLSFLCFSTPLDGGCFPEVYVQKGATHSEPVVEGPLGGDDVQVQLPCALLNASDERLVVWRLSFVGAVFVQLCYLGRWLPHVLTRFKCLERFCLYRCFRAVWKKKGLWRLVGGSDLKTQRLRRKIIIWGHQCQIVFLMHWFMQKPNSPSLHKAVPRSFGYNCQHA